MQHGTAKGFRNNQRSQSETAGSREDESPEATSSKDTRGSSGVMSSRFSRLWGWRKEDRCLGRVWNGSLEEITSPTREAETPKVYPHVKDKKYQHVPCLLPPPQRAVSKSTYCLNSSLGVGSKEKVTSLRIYNHKLVLTCLAARIHTKHVMGKTYVQILV